MVPENSHKYIMLHINNCDTSSFQWYESSHKSLCSYSFAFPSVSKPIGPLNKIQEKQKTSPTSQSKAKKENANAWQFQSTITNQSLTDPLPMKNWPTVENLFR